jgi:hypothetical protein
LSFRSLPPHPSPLPQGVEGEGSRSSGFSKPEFDWIFQVDVSPEINSVGPLSLRERGKGADLLAFQNLSSTGYLRSMYYLRTTP